MDEGDKKSIQSRLDKESVRLRMHIAWLDHWHSRDQSWKALQFVAVIFVAFIGIDFRFENAYVTAAAGLISILAAVSGLAVTMHHRNGVQVREFKLINRFQRYLGLMCKYSDRGNKKGISIDDKCDSCSIKCDYVIRMDDGIKDPEPIKIWDIFGYKKNNTPLFLMRIYFIIAVVSLILIAFRLIVAT